MAGYPKSHFFTVGFELHLGGHTHTDLAIDAFQRGTNVCCVPSMLYYAELQRLHGNVHLSLLIYLEAAIRGHFGSILC